MDDSEEAKRARAGVEAAAEVADGMVLGLGTGRTAEAFMNALAARMAGGLAVVGVPTSQRTASFAERLGIPLSDLDTHPTLDLTVDGADEINARMMLIKGGGGALLREKIVASASAEMLVVVDGGKVVKELGAFPLPIEIIPFGARATIRHIEGALAQCGLSGALTVRQSGEGPFTTDSGNHIVDASLGRIPDPESLAAKLSPIPGVVEHGLFVHIASRAIIAGADGIERL
ncbi:MAG: ribose-5-phosphate isomerase RpiA [Alphaproteobacteria bacterium]